MKLGRGHLHKVIKISIIFSTLNTKNISTHLLNWSYDIMVWMPCCLVKAVRGGTWPHTENRVSAEAKGANCFMAAGVGSLQH